MSSCILPLNAWPNTRSTLCAFTHPCPLLSRFVAVPLGRFYALIFFQSPIVPFHALVSAVFCALGHLCTDGPWQITISVLVATFERIHVLYVQNG